MAPSEDDDVRLESSEVAEVRSGSAAWPSPGAPSELDCSHVLAGCLRRHVLHDIVLSSLA